MSKLEGQLRDLDGRSMTLAEGVAQADGTVEDGMLEIDFKLSTTGETVIVEELVAAGSVFRIPKAGEIALLGFVDGDRNEGYVLGWINRPDASPVPTLVSGVVYVHARAGETVRIVSDSGVVLETPEVKAGGDAAIQAVGLAPKEDLLWLKLYTLFTAWVPIPADGGAALKTAFAAAFPEPPASVASSKLKAE